MTVVCRNGHATQVRPSRNRRECGSDANGIVREP